MTRTILLAATAVAALVTSSFMVTAADARGGGFASHSSPSHSVSHAVTHAVSHTVSHAVATRPANHFRPAAQTVSHAVAHIASSQTHQNLTSFTRSNAHVAQAHIATPQQKTTVQTVANANLKQGKVDIAQATVARINAGALQAQAKADALKGDKAREASDLARASADAKRAQQLNSQGQKLVKTSKAELAVVGNRATPSQIAQVRQTATADINRANILSRTANGLQAKAKLDGAKGNKTLEAADLGRANADLNKAGQLRNDATAEKAAIRGQRI